MKKILFVVTSIVLLFSWTPTSAQCNFTGNFLAPVYNCTTQNSSVKLRICGGTIPSGSFYLVSGGTSYSGSVGGPLGPCPKTVNWSNIPNGNYTLKVNTTICSSYTVAVTTPSSGVITITPSGSPSLCQGESITLTASGGSNYSWSANTGGSWTGTSITVSPSSNTTYTLTGTKSGACGGTGSDTQPVFVTPVVGPVSNPSGTLSRCQGSGSSTYSASAANAGNGYSWAISSNEAISPGSISTSGVVTWNSSFSGDVTVTAYGCNASSTTASTNVHVYFIPTAYNVSAPASICAGATATVTLTGSQSSVSYQLYKNNVDIGASVGGTGAPLQWTGMTEGTYKVIAYPPGCSSVEMANQRTIATTSPGTVSITPSRSPFLCQSESITLTASGGYNYSWSANTGGTWTGSPITVIPSTTTTYTLTGNESSCNTTKTATLQVSVTPVVGQVSTPSGSLSRCQGSGTSTYTASATNAGNGYTWTITSNEATSPGSVSSTGVVTWNSAFSGIATVSVAAYGCNGSTSTAFADVTVNFIPTAYNLSAPASICPGTTATVTLTGSQPGVSYQLYKNNIDIGASVSGTGSPLQWTGMTQGTYKVIAYQANCASVEMANQKTIGTSSPPDVYGSGYSCEYNTANIHAESASGVSAYYLYRYEDSGSGFTYNLLQSNSTGDFTINDFYSDEANYISNYYLRGQSTLGCWSSYFNVDIDVMRPAMPAVTGDTEVCYDHSTLLTASGGYEGSYRWYVGANIIPGETGSQYNTGNVINAVPYYVSYVEEGYSGGQCESPKRQVDIDIVPLPEKPSAINPAARRCGTGTVTLEVWGPYNDFQWYDANDQPVSGATFATYSFQIDELNTEEIFKAKGISAEGCESELTALSATAVSDCENYVHNEVVSVRGITSENQLISLTADEKGDTRNYFDGLGKPVQTIGMQVSPDLRDVISVSTYDDLGRVAQSVLPYTSAQNTGKFRSTALTEIYDYYANNFGDNSPAAVTIFDKSPLGRVVEQGGVGDAWQPNSTIPADGKTRKFLYGTNDAGDAVLIWTVTSADNSEAVTISSSPYPSNTLEESITVDDANPGHLQTVIYKDLMEHTVLQKSQLDGTQWAETYYVYDKFGQLRAVLPPKAVQMIKDQSLTVVSGSILDDYAFLYLYDNEGRRIAEKSPGD